MKKLVSNTNRKIIYLSYGHALLEEQYGKLIEAGVSKDNIRHWKGLKLMCPCLKKNEEGLPKVPLIAKLVDLKIPNAQICSVCQKGNLNSRSKCEYQEQFKNMNVPNVLAPIEYVFTKRFVDYAPDVIIVDDCLTKDRKHPNHKMLNELLATLSDSSPWLSSLYNLQELAKATQFNLSKIVPKLDRAYKINLKEHIEDIKNNISGVRYDPLYTTSPKEIKIYLEKAKVHGFQEQFSTSTLFPIFGYIWENKREGKEIEFTLIEAIINKRFLKIITDCYRKEKGVDVVFERDEFRPKIVNHGSIFYHMGNNNMWFPKASLKKKHVREKIRKQIEWILAFKHDNNPKLKIGVITFKPAGRTASESRAKLYKRARWYIPEHFKNIEAEWYGNTRGKNNFKECDVLFLIGTYSINKDSMLKKLRLLSGHKPSTDEFVDPLPHGGYYCYKDEELEACRWQYEDYEMYQCTHRNRPMLGKKQIYGFCLVPKDIELKVVRLKGSWILKSMWLLNYVKQNSGKAHYGLAVHDMKDEFKLKSIDWSRREILGIVRNTDLLDFRLNGKTRWIVYEPWDYQ